MSMKNEFRAPGEFEKLQAVTVFWPKVREPIAGHDAFAGYAAVVKELVKEVKVYINCGIEGVIEDCRQALTEAGVDLDRIYFTQFPDHTSWARDYGPDIMINDAGELRNVGFRFNVYGQSDPDFPMSVHGTNMGPHMAIELGVKDLVFSKLFSEGGDREQNGRGVMMAISDTEGRKRNPELSLEEVEAEFKWVFNLEKVIWLPLPTYDDESIFEGILDTVDGRNIYRSASANGHIDEMCRFVDEQTIILAEVTEEEAAELQSARISRQRLEEAYEILKQATDADGNPFKILRMPIPEPIYLDSQPGDWTNNNFGAIFSEDNVEQPLDDGTPMPKGVITVQPAMSYCNFLIVNGRVLGQKYWKEGMDEKIKAKDELAEKVLQEAFPDREIVMLDTLAVNIRGGGIHCITKNIPAPTIQQ